MLLSPSRVSANACCHVKIRYTHSGYTHKDLGTPVLFLSVTSKLCTAPQLQGSERLLSRIVQLNKMLIN